MRDVVYRYSALNVDIVTLDVGEEFRFVQTASSESYGVFYYHGSTEMLEGAIPGRVFDSVGVWRPNAENGWSNDHVGHSEMLLKAGPQGAKWMCLSRNGSSEKAIEHIVASGNTTIPAGVGVVVATGAVEIDGRTAVVASFIRPRAADFIVIGSADLLLVRG